MPAKNTNANFYIVNYMIGLDKIYENLFLI